MYNNNYNKKIVKLLFLQIKYKYYIKQGVEMARKTIFISDLHLQEKQKEITRSFFELLMNLDTSVDALYILGDLFEIWVGDDDTTEFHCAISQALYQTAQKGISIYFMHGNRDFLLGKRYLHNTGCQLLLDPTKMTIYGTQILLTHGDILCTRDVAYLKARVVLRNRFIQILFLLLPLVLRKKIAAYLREKSAKHTKSTMIEIMDVTQEEVEKVMINHSVSHLIHGHTHRPDIHHFVLNHIPATRIVLGAWHDHGHILIWDENGKKELVKIK
jgi:UDP-2,3-diacylglucosamine hydrolase